jgi:hypothetical protein
MHSLMSSMTRQVSVDQRSRTLTALFSRARKVAAREPDRVASRTVSSSVVSMN